MKPMQFVSIIGGSQKRRPDHYPSKPDGARCLPGLHNRNAPKFARLYDARFRMQPCAFLCSATEHPLYYAKHGQRKWHLSPPLLKFHQTVAFFCFTQLEICVNIGGFSQKGPPTQGWAPTNATMGCIPIANAPPLKKKKMGKNTGKNRRPQRRG
ncbi:hypothetical protein CEXT_418381 [Caerostris extrusa]|uniref:Uncharacterized protein n=1 Tax=Caerostris extrusa TaxID=172846 RepID=A0AAV4WUJ5_CAEEX|nr:hypothetical protein CEXT_418381 [Caerostris extrusa]